MDPFFPKPLQDGPGRGDEKDTGDDGDATKRGSGKDKEHYKERHIRDKWSEQRTVKELLYGLGGYIGLNPRPFTFRQLLIMADGKDHNEWFQVARVVTEIHNVNCTKKSDMIDFRHVHPHYISESIKESERGPTSEEVAMIKRELNSWECSQT